MTTNISSIFTRSLTFFKFLKFTNLTILFAPNPSPLISEVIERLLNSHYFLRLDFSKKALSLIFECTAQKMTFSIKNFFSKCDQIRRKLRIWSHSLKKSIMENFIFCTVVSSNKPLVTITFSKREILETYVSVWGIFKCKLCFSGKELRTTLHWEMFWTA